MKAVPATRLIAFVSIVVVGCAVDLATKQWVFSWLGMPGHSPSYWLIENLLGFTTSLNEGALFGMGQGRVSLFAAMSMLAAIGISYWLFVAGAAKDWMLTIALGMVTGGILGNLYDRLGMPGLKWSPPDLRSHAPGDPVFAVRDWIHFRIHALDYNWPLFNIADSLLVCGAGLLILHSILSDLKAKHPTDQPSSPQPTVANPS
jgi:signal peptidase II